MHKYKISQFWYIILIIIAAMYFYFYKYKKYNAENFISSIYRPHLRHARRKYENFIDNYGDYGHHHVRKYFMNKF